MELFGGLEPTFVREIADEIGATPNQVASASVLLADGATVPFIARYRKEATGGLDDAQLEILAKRRQYFLNLVQRRDEILRNIAKQNKLTPQLEEAIKNAKTLQALEDLYLPYKPKRRTKGQIAREKGLEPLADLLLEKAETEIQPEELAEKFIDGEKGITDTATALEGAGHILAERFAETAEIRSSLREKLLKEGEVVVTAIPGAEENPDAAVYRDYFDFREKAETIPSHRLLAAFRGEREGFLILDIELDDDQTCDELAYKWFQHLESPCGQQIFSAIKDGYRRLLRPSITNEVRKILKKRAEDEAIAVFRANLEALLMQPPLGRVPVLGIDPGERTGAKVAAVDSTGKVLATATVYPLPPRSDVEGTARLLSQWLAEYSIRAIAIGNGTGSRQTEKIVKQIVRELDRKDLIVAIVPETGASVYSASALAREELPDLDVSLRGAVSIARRLQDPLAELVKIEPRSLGVGQYQHDVDQKALAKELDLTVEKVVNRVGVQLNTASYALLKYVSGLNLNTAKEIVKFRDQNGPFSSREELLKVKGIGPKTFEQAAGFLRIYGAKNPLDQTAVHPERYPLVEKMALSLGVSVKELIGNPQLIEKINWKEFIDTQAGVGEFTLRDIKEELTKPGRDPRPEYRAPQWRDDVTDFEDLREGMILEGRVSNVTNFGAFVDIGVKRDGLVHISELSHQWVSDPREVVSVGQIVKVKVIEIDRQRKRIGLSIKALTPSDSGTPKKKKREEKREITIDDLINKFSGQRS